MGCSDAICLVTGMPVKPGEEAYALLLDTHVMRQIDESTHFAYMPAFKGKADSYGMLEEYEFTPFHEKCVKYMQRSFKNKMVTKENLWSSLIDKEIPLTWVLIKAQIYDKLVSLASQYDVSRSIRSEIQCLKYADDAFLINLDRTLKGLSKVKSKKKFTPRSRRSVSRSSEFTKDLEQWVEEGDFDVVFNHLLFMFALRNLHIELRPKPMCQQIDKRMHFEVLKIAAKCLTTSQSGTILTELSKYDKIYK